jgi:hypothetical protein
MLLHLAARRGMLIGDINGAPAVEHPAARLFIEEGFVATALGLQARTAQLEPRGYGSLDPTGIGIAATGHGGRAMAEEIRPEDDPTLIGNSKPRQKETSEDERERVRSSNDLDQSLERKGVVSPQNRGYDEVVRGERPTE